MNIEYLHYFLDVAKTHSIAQAAKLNFISSQGMSRAMGELEKELGCQLFFRYSNKLSLSPVGEELISITSRVVDDYRELLELAAAKCHPEPGREGTLLLDCQNVAMLAFLIQEAKEFILASDEIIFRESQNSQIRQDLLASVSEQGASRIPSIGLFCFFNHERNTDEAAITSLEEAGFQYRPYLRTYDEVMVNSGSALASMDVLSDEVIGAQPIVATNSHLYSILARRYGQSAISLSSPSFSLRRQLVASNAAISFLPAIAELTVPEDPSFVLKPMERPYEVEIGFAGLEKDLDSDAFKSLKAILDSFYEAHLDSGLYELCH